MRRTQSILVIAGLTLGVSASTALAAAKPVASPTVVQALLDCGKIADNAQRLACYDKASAAIKNATASGDLVSIDREQRRAARRQAFGFTLPSLSFLDHGEAEGAASRVTAMVVEANLDPTDRWVLRLDDGAVWTQTDPEQIGRRPHKGSVVVIGRGAMGGFFMTIDGQGAGKAKRLS
jgi:hypothetical protein